MSSLVTTVGIEQLIGTKLNGEQLPEGWQSDVRLYFHRKLEYVKGAKFVPEYWWFRQFINNYDDVTYMLELDIKEYEHARNCFDHFLRLLHENFIIMLGKLKEAENRVRTANFGEDSGVSDIL